MRVRVRVRRVRVRVRVLCKLKSRLRNKPTKAPYLAFGVGLGTFVALDGIADPSHLLIARRHGAPYPGVIGPVTRFVGRGEGSDVSKKADCALGWKGTTHRRVMPF
jgi:hypothetical protein